MRSKVIYGYLSHYVIFNNGFSCNRKFLYRYYLVSERGSPEKFQLRRASARHLNNQKISAVNIHPRIFRVASPSLYLSISATVGTRIFSLFSAGLCVPGGTGDARASVLGFKNPSLTSLVSRGYLARESNGDLLIPRPGTSTFPPSLPLSLSSASIVAVVARRGVYAR